MNIALIAPPTLPIPPFEGYGGTQRGIHDLLKYLPAMDHTIHLLAPGDSNVKGLEGVILHETIPKSLNNILHHDEDLLKKENREYRNNVLGTLHTLIEKGKIDIINSRIIFPDILENISKFYPNIPIVVSLHIFNDDMRRINPLNNLEGKFYYTTHCINHRNQFSSLKNVDVIIYGIDISSYSYSKQKLSQTDYEGENKKKISAIPVLKDLKSKSKDYFIIVSRISKIKGQKTAIKLVLEETCDDIILVGEPSLRGGGTEGREYMRSEISPYLDNQRVHYFGNADEEQKKILLMYSKGFLFPSGFEDQQWKEPFGRSPVEALACGVPVLAYHHGSMPEIISHEKCGFLFNNMTEARKYINQLQNIEREKCRQHAENFFDAKRVAVNYDALFKKVQAASRQSLLEIV